jgi:uncharacterized OB-fold protein
MPAPKRNKDLPKILTKCLKCGNLFFATSKVNKICPSCKNSDEWRDGDAGPYKTLSK